MWRNLEKESQIKIVDKIYRLPDIETRKNEIIKELQNLEYNVFEDLVFRREITNNEIEKYLVRNMLPRHLQLALYHQAFMRSLILIWWYSLYLPMR